MVALATTKKYVKCITLYTHSQMKKKKNGEKRPRYKLNKRPSTKYWIMYKPLITPLYNLNNS